MVVHWVGPVVTIGGQVRQRCVWCGYLLLDENPTSINVAIDPASDPRGDLEATRMPTWAEGSHVAVDGAATYVYALIDDESLPPEHCGWPWSQKWRETHG